MANTTITAAEQAKHIGLQEVLPFKTTTHINFGTGNINTGVAAEKVTYDPSTGALNAPTGAAKTKCDTLDERTISGNSFDTVNIAQVLGH